MSYGTYNLSLYRNGYRPIGETSPFAATHLGQVHPFGPWRLHGMGQSHPFTPGGGWRLHGLGAMVPDQAVVIYQGKWQTTATTFDLMNAIVHPVEDALAQDGLTVRNEKVSAPTAAQLGFGNIPFSITLTIQVNNGQGYGDPNDIIAVINHEVYVVTGRMPLAGSIVSVSAPSGGAPQGTGQPIIPEAPDANCAAGMPYSVTGAPCPPPPGAAVDPLVWLEQHAGWIALGVGALVVLPMVMGRR